MTHFGIIGTGSLAATLLRASHAYAPEIELIVAGRNSSRTKALQREIPGLVAASPEDLARVAELVVLCIPPEAYLPLVDRIAPLLGPRAIVVSVNNAVPLATIVEHAHKPVVKAIPTIAHVVGRGVSLLVAAPDALPEHIEAARTICDTFVSANAVRAATLPRATLDAMMAETAGAIAALVKAEYSWSDIVRATATPGGMTHAALEVLASHFPRLAADMIEATLARQAAIQNRQEPT